MRIRGSKYAQLDQAEDSSQAILFYSFKIPTTGTKIPYQNPLLTTIKQNTSITKRQNQTYTMVVQSTKARIYLFVAAVVLFAIDGGSADKDLEINVDLIPKDL